MSSVSKKKEMLESLGVIIVQKKSCNKWDDESISWQGWKNPQKKSSAESQPVNRSYGKQKMVKAILFPKNPRMAQRPTSPTNYLLTDPWFFRWSSSNWNKDKPEIFGKSFINFVHCSVNNPNVPNVWNNHLPFTPTLTTLTRCWEM